MTTRKLTLTRADRKARFLALQEEAFDLLFPDGADDVEVYSTESADLWPRRARSRRHARDLIRAVPGHQRHGRGRETVWTVEAESYRVHHSRRPVAKASAPVPAEVSPTAPTDDDEIAARSLEGVRMRSTRRTG